MYLITIFKSSIAIWTHAFHVSVHRFWSTGSSTCFKLEWVSSAEIFKQIAIEITTACLPNWTTLSVARSILLTIAFLGSKLWVGGFRTTKKVKLHKFVNPNLYKRSLGQSNRCLLSMFHRLASARSFEFVSEYHHHRFSNRYRMWTRMTNGPRLSIHRTFKALKNWYSEDQNHTRAATNFAVKPRFQNYPEAHSNSDLTLVRLSLKSPKTLLLWNNSGTYPQR